MKRIVATTFAALAIAMTAPLALAQTQSSPETAPPATAPRGTETGPGMMYGQGQAQVPVQGQVPAQGQTQNQGDNGPGMYRQGQGANGPWMMGNYGIGWMGGYAGIGMLLLLVVTVGAVAVIVMQKRK